MSYGVDGRWIDPVTIEIDNGTRLSNEQVAGLIHRGYGDVLAQMDPLDVSLIALHTSEARDILLHKNTSLVQCTLQPREVIRKKSCFLLDNFQKRGGVGRWI